MAALYIVERFRVCDYPLVNRKLETMVKSHIKKMLKGHSLDRIYAISPNKFKLVLLDAYGVVKMWTLDLLDSEFDEFEAMYSYEYTLDKDTK